MKKNIVIAALVVAALFLLSRSCGLTSAYKDMRNSYNELKNITAADKQMSDARILELTNKVSEADNAIGHMNKDIAVKDAKITLLSKQLSDIVGQEPPTTPDIEAMPIVVNLRGQLSKLSNMYSISVDIINDKDKIIGEWAKKFDAQVKISDEWKGQYDRERSLRLSAEKLVVSLEKRVKLSGAWGTTKTVLIGAAAVYIAGSLIKK